MSKYLIAGGTGMIGSKLIKKLKQNNIEYVFLSTQKKDNPLKNRYHWNPSANIFPDIDLKSFDGVINFCGANIFERGFTSKRKKVLINSRIEPVYALKKAFEDQNVKTPVFISASASGYYPNECSDWLDEDSLNGQGFIPNLVSQWEDAIFSCRSIADHVCAIRIGIVLSDTGGFLSPLSKSIRWFVGAIPGTGKQMVSWVHVDDLCEQFLFAINRSLDGVLNGTSPSPESLGTITRTLASKLNRPILLPNIPVFALKLLFGQERHRLLLSDQKIRPKRFLDSGFEFKFPTLNQALDDLFP